MHRRKHGRPPRALRTLLVLATLAGALSAMATGAIARSYWYLGVPPEVLERWRPATPEAASHPPFAGSSSAAQAKGPALPASVTPGAPETATWEPLASMGTRYLHESVLDPLTHRVVVFGGFGQPGGNPPELTSAGPLNGAGAWEALGLGSAESPARRLWPAVAFDPARHALLVFGGQALDGTGAMLGDLWSLSLEPGGTWTRLEPAGPAPAARCRASLFWDAPRERFLLAGGAGPAALSEFWELRLAPAPAWRALTFDNDAGVNLGAVLGDPVHGDAWCVAWQYAIHHLAISADSVEAGPAIAMDPDSSNWDPPNLLLADLDPVERRLLWFQRPGGMSRALMDQPSWFSLDGSGALAPVGVAGTAPADRYLFGADWDPDARRLVVTGGYDDDLGYFGDAWALAASPMIPTPVTATPRLAESDARGVRIAWRVTDGSGARALVQRSGDGAEWRDAGEARWAGGDELSYEGPPLAPLERAAFRLVISPGANEARTAPVWVSGPAPTTLALAPRRNPAGPDLALSLSLAPGSPARLRVLDAAGRVVADTRVAAGANAWSLGHAAPPGLYFAELMQGAERRVVKLASVR